eukprot:TRINITY_DN427_c1_g1_i1.p5 TRINITY_DN427_c1_g1~~TRINITY_DN427_c1_g1_i1.p5  ORF type:complete len:59 (-),score=16.13 TRINITY_DN427_c1_g1_i1:88-264(-)
MVKKVAEDTCGHLRNGMPGFWIDYIEDWRESGRWAGVKSSYKRKADDEEDDDDDDDDE